jgi:hypothetical protein
MRKIEQQMNSAISNSVKYWKKDNTEVQTPVMKWNSEGKFAESVDNVDRVSYVYLHGNKIAEVGDNYIVLYDGGWQSKTTKSRLNAILAEHGLPGERIFSKNFEWFLQQEGGPVPFFSGMRLN